MRCSIALVLACLLAGNAAANPLAFVLANPESAPEISDPAASNAHEAAGEPAATGELDAADLSKLGGRLAAIALAYEAFRDPSNLDAGAKLLVDYTSPQGLIPYPADRAQTLDRVYRALALLDDTQALRYPEGDACARAHRRALLRSPDGLFADPITGELSPWLKAELKRSKANDAPGGLIAASAREWSALGYLKSLAEVRAISLRLADKKVLGAPRAAAYCLRAKLYEDLASAQAFLRWNDPDLTAQSKSVVEVRWGKESGTGTALLVDGKTVVLVSGRFTENAYEAPDLFARSGRRLSAAYARRGPTLSLLSIQPSQDVEPLAFPSKSGEGERVAYAIGHPIQGGPWSVTRGLAQPEGALVFTDAAIDEAQAGGPLFDPQGRLIGIVAGKGTAYGLAAVKSWLADENAKLPEVSNATESGTGALLTASTTIAPKEKGGLIESGSSFNSNPTFVCVDTRGCEMPSAPLGGGSEYSAPYNGPNLWSMLGKLLRPAQRIEPKVEDNRRYASPVVIHEAPKPPPSPLKPASLNLSVSRTSLAQGGEFEAVATVTFTGKEGSVAGRGVSFTGVPGGKIICPAARTDASGVARTTCTALEDGRDTTFDSLQDETRRRLGMRTPGRVRRKVAKGDKIAALKEKEASAMDALDGEEGKYPELGTTGSDTPGLDRTFPEDEITELEIKGDRVTLGASIEKLIDNATIDVLERPCPDGTLPGPLSNNPNRYRCGNKPGGKPVFNDFSGKAEAQGPESEEVEGSPDKDEEDKDDEDFGFREKTRKKARDKLPRDRQMGGEDTDPWKGKGPKKGTKEREDLQREIEKEKRGSGIGSAGTVEDIK